MRGLRLGLSLVGGGFTPAKLFTGQNGAWYDPSDLSTLFQDTAGTTPVTADGQPVALIKDKSGNGHHLTQATAANCPLYKTSGGLSWLQFDGVNDCLASSAIDLSAYGQIGAAVGVTPLSTAAGVTAEFGPNTNNTDGTFMPCSVNDPAAGQLSAEARGLTGPDAIATTGATYGSGVSSLASYQSLDITQAAAMSKLPLRINGAAAAITATSDGGPAGTVFGNQVLYVGSRAGSSLFLSGKIHGLIIRGGAFSATELAQIEHWLGTRMGLSL